MKITAVRNFFLFIFISISISGISQDSTDTGDQQETPRIELSASQAIKFLLERCQPQYWKETGDPLRRAIRHLVNEASNPPYDSLAYFLKRYPYDSLNIPWNKFYIREPLRSKVPVTATAVYIDSLQVIDTLRAAAYYTYPFQGDSIRVAVKTLMDFLEARDSSMIHVTGLGGAVTNIWLNSRSDIMKRYWLRNEMNDSITVWIGAPAKDTISLYLEKRVDFRRPVKQGNYSDARIEVQEVDKSTLLDVRTIPVKSQYWKYHSEASFALNQGAVTNWVKGGESSISTALDITGYANYENKKQKITSNNFARIKYGLIASGDNEVRKNLDLLETNSKLNHKAFGKFDFSCILLFKTQIDKGFNYTKVKVDGKDRDTALLVSKLLNPAILTAGFGLDYKPNKNTSINFSPLSYKATFVHDTANIDQTKYGVAADKRSKHEPGMSFMITNEFKPLSTVTITNRLQLFTNYINNPQNIDVDWEMIVTAALNWFTDVRFNTHLIFDDDTKTPVFDKGKQPVLDPVTGKQKSTARIQFKELLGFSFVFRF
jgi:hypothetical protein